MVDYESIYKNENIEDVLLHFAPRMPYQNIDRMYVNYKFEVIANGLLLKTYQRLIEEKKLLTNGTTIPDKGPNWTEPKFVTEKKYGIK